MLTYYNDHRLEIEGIFSLPLDYVSQVVEFEANVEGRYIFVDTQGEGDLNAVSRHGIFQDEQRDDDLFCISIGKLTPWILVDVQVTIISEIKSVSEKSALKFNLPSVFTPRIVQDAPGGDENNLQKSPDCFNAISTLGYSLQIEICIEAPCLLAGVTSETYPIQVDATPQDDDASKLRVSLPENFESCDKDFELMIYLSKPREPFIYIEEAQYTHSNEIAERNPIGSIMTNPVLMLSYCPNTCSSTNDDAGLVLEFVFMIDRSGSMNGNLINNAKETILLFLRSLPVNCYFNVISFGTYFQSLFKDSQPYSQANLEEACNYVRKIRADMGGTSLVEPLEWVLNRPLRKGIPRQIFLVTDGMVSDALQVLDCVRRKFTRWKV